MVRLRPELDKPAEPTEPEFTIHYGEIKTYIKSYPSMMEAEIYNPLW